MHTIILTFEEWNNLYDLVENSDLVNLEKNTLNPLFEINELNLNILEKFSFINYSMKSKLLTSNSKTLRLFLKKAI